MVPVAVQGSGWVALGLRGRSPRRAAQAYQLGPDQAPNYALEGAIAIAGAGVSWLRDKLGVISDAAASEALAASVPDTGGTAPCI